MSSISKEEIQAGFMDGIHCSMQVVREWAEDVGLDEKNAMRIAAPFGGGCCAGEVCGCVTGALIVIGARYGHCQPKDFQANAAMQAKTREFLEKFRERHGTLLCRELMGHDLSKPEEIQKAFEDGSIMERCPDYVNTALEILDEIMD